MIKELTREMLWEAGVQYGHHSKKWNPKMKSFIYGKKNNIHIIDLQQTIWKLEDVKKLILNIALKKGKILFVGTKKQAKLIIKDAAERTNNFYVNERWLGGTLTNLKTIQLKIKKLWNIEYREKIGELKLLTKKEQVLIFKEKEKLEKFLCGIKEMKELPQALFVVDPKEEYISVNEAKKLKIPIIAICDTNIDPDNIDYIIPGNDDTFRSIAIITYYVSDLYGDAIGLVLPQPQFRPQEFKKKEELLQQQQNLNNIDENNKITEQNVLKDQNMKGDIIQNKKNTDIE